MVWSGGQPYHRDKCKKQRYCFARSILAQLLVIFAFGSIDPKTGKPIKFIGSQLTVVGV